LRQFFSEILIMFQRLSYLGGCMENKLLSELSRNGLRNKLINHQLFTEISLQSVSKETAALMVGQWYHPLHYFPCFLSRQIAVTPLLEMQTFISKILWQELGEGKPEQAHEKLFIKTMHDSGFDRKTIMHPLPFDATQKLVEGYRKSTDDYLIGLGYLYGTEVADLVMVSSIGKAVEKATGKKELPWVDIHIKQEPNHVESASQALTPFFTEKERKKIVASAEEMWKLWIGFFDEIREKAGSGGQSERTPKLMA